MTKAVIACVLLFIFLSHADSECPKKVVACYYTGWSIYREDKGKFTMDDIDASLCTHLIYSFAGLDINARITSLDPTYDVTQGGYKAMTALKAKNPCLKTLLAIGGWNEGSRKYSIMSSLNTSRVDFAESALRYLAAYNFDGLDFDWEYPTQRGGVTQDKIDFVELLNYLHKRFEKWGLLLTVAVPLDVNYLSAGYAFDGIKEAVDYVFLMAYDYTAVDSKTTGLLAPMTPIKKAVEFLIENVGAEKVVLGLPTYARTFKLMNKAENGIDAPTNGTGFPGKYTKTEGFLAYYELLELTNTGRYNVKRSDGTYYAYYSVAWVSFDTKDSYQAKVNYAMENHLAGVMIWSIDTDDFKGLQSDTQYPILNWIHEVL